MKTGPCLHWGDATTLLPLIEHHVRPGSHIMSDGWLAYDGIATMNGGVYMHDVIVHERHFVQPDDEHIHTQNVENIWMRAKRKLKRPFETTRELFPTYLSEFQWRSNYQDHEFDQIITAICYLYYVGQLEIK